MRLVIPAFLLAAGLAPAHAQTAAITADHAWARASAGQVTTGAAYMTLTDTGAADHLTGISTPVATTAELHETIDDHGVMRMRPAPPLTIQPGSPVTFKPGGLHIMLMGLKHPLKPGEHFPVTLTFEHASSITADVLVGTVGASAAPMDMMGMTK